MIKLTRRQTLAGLGAIAALPATRVFGASPALPSAPVALNIIDVAGNLALTQKAMEAYAAAHTNLISAITFNKATSPELPGKSRPNKPPAASISTWCCRVPTR
jgi:putative spermidine/putrescine transport system substrate-binding protein